MYKQKTTNVLSGNASPRLHEMQHFSIFAALTVGMYLFSCNSASAGVIGEVLCSVIGMVMLDIGRGLATMAIIMVGVSALLGKASWGQALMVITGIGLIFGAQSIMLILSLTMSGTIATVSAFISNPLSAIKSLMGTATCLLPK